MEPTIVFLDAVRGNEWSLKLTDADMIFLNETWYKEDELLIGLCTTNPFFGRTTWSDLELVHYQILFIQAFKTLTEKASDNEVSLRYREPFLTFRFLASALVKMSRLNSVDGFDIIEISYADEDKIRIEYRRTCDFDFTRFVPPPLAIPKPVENPFKVVVDNTK